MNKRPSAAALKREFERFKAVNPGWPAILHARWDENVIKVTFVPPHDPIFIVISDGNRGYLAPGPEVIEKYEGRVAAKRLKARED